ncbi:MAG: LysR substrate-binding domain-containing protein [Pseudonocardia sp.]|nr:LysR substrate-binding domain-containing protein [Pseudonocardia sp.]
MSGTHGFDVETLRLLVAVADTGSFTRAAARLDYTQSAVSRRIAALEEQAGGALFERLPRGVRLRPAGDALYRHAVDILERMALAHRELAAIHDGRGGTLRIGAFATANIALLPAALQALLREQPGIDVVVREQRSHVSMRGLTEGTLDVAVVSDYPSGLPTVDGVTTSALVRDEVHVALRRDHRLAGTGAIDLRDLREEVWLQDAPAASPTMMADAWARAGFAPRRTVRVAEWAGKFGYVAAGLGVALVPALAATAVPAGLVLCRIGDAPPQRTVSVALPAAPLPSALRLRQLLARAVAEIGPDRDRC